MSKSLKYDGDINIATGASRTELRWKNKKMLWSEFTQRLSNTTRTAESFQEYMKLSKEKQDAIKDVGGFVGGQLKQGRRKTGSVVSRCLITLDADFADETLWDKADMIIGCACAMYSTHKHSPDNMRLRLIFPLSRPVTAEEYEAIARKIAEDIGIDLFDDTTYQPHRLMYWPSTSQNGEYVFKVSDAPWIDADEILNRYVDWTDSSMWPESSRVIGKIKSTAEKQGEPAEKPGPIGAFCRAYTIHEAIAEFLPDVYESCAMDNRFTYTPGSTTAGAIIYDDKFLYSHHGTDPASGRLCNAFDLVRIHKFGKQDEDSKEDTPINRLPSFKAMSSFAASDEKVRLLIGKERLADAMDEFEELDEKEIDVSWVKKLTIDRTSGRIEEKIENIIIILENDPLLAGKLALNEFCYKMTIKENLPWRKVEPDVTDYWKDTDDAGLRHYLEKHYGLASKQKAADAVDVVFERHKFHPIREYLRSLEWDGKERVSTLFIDYLGAEDNDYVRAVTRKSIVAAVARVFVPGIKFDNIVVLIGPQGIGKSTLLFKLSKGWFTDSLTTVAGKEAYESIIGSWIIEMAELSALKKSETENVKHFISKQEDKFRPAYGRRVELFKRQCVFFGTTNEMEFMKDKTGGRRFWPVMTTEGVKSVFDDLTEYEIDQIWAEAMRLFKAKETLFLDRKLEKNARELQERHTEESPKAGAVREYLDTLLPEDWEDFDIGRRRAFIQGDEFSNDTGIVRRDKVCAMEIWVEVFNGDPKQLTQQVSREINDILINTKGWKRYEKGNGKIRFGKIYGQQRGFIRV